MSRPEARITRLSKTPEPLPDNVWTTGIYDRTAQARGLRALVGGDWLDVGGVSYGAEVGGVVPSIPERFNPEALTRRLERLGYYERNNGIISVVHSDGRYLIGIANGENHRAVKEARYMQGLWVPFSNGEEPSDPQERMTFRHFVNTTGRK